MARGVVPTFLCAALFLAACDGPPRSSEIHAEGAWARAMPSGGNSAVYLILENRGDVQDRLEGAETPAASSVEIHESRVDEGIIRMREVEGIPLPGGESVELAPGGIHLMLVGLPEALVEGDTLRLDLRFQEAGTLVLRVPVRGAGEG